MTRTERVARAMCRFHGLPEDTKYEGRPMWESYIPEAETILAALENDEGVASDRS